MCFVVMFDSLDRLILVDSIPERNLFICHGQHIFAILVRIAIACSFGSDEPAQYRHLCCSHTRNMEDGEGSGQISIL